MNNDDFPTTRLYRADQAPVEPQPFGTRVGPTPQRLPSQQDRAQSTQTRLLQNISNRVMFIAVCVGILTAVLLGALGFGAYTLIHFANTVNNSTGFSNCQSVGGTDPSC